MKYIQLMLDRRPLISVLITVVISVGMLFLIHSSGFFEKSTFNPLRLLAQNGVAIGLMVILHKLGWAKSSGITLSIGNWNRRWFFATFPMLLIGLINFAGVAWGEVNFKLTNMFLWLLANISTGLFEEVLLRGFGFYVLYRLWGSSRKGLYLAALTQALIFGLVHLVNLVQMPAIDVIAQVIYATLLGIGFAGLVSYTRSIWPAVIVHIFINSIGTINEFFNPAYHSVEFNSPGIAGYIVGILIIFLVSTLPGLWLLKKSRLYIHTE